VAKLINQPDPVYIAKLSTVQAQVTEGVVTPDDQFAGYVTQPTPQTVFTDYVVNSRFEKDFHRYMLGMTTPTGFVRGTAAFVQLAAPTLLWVVDWTACRTAVMPVIPSTVTYDRNWVLLDEHVEPSMLTLAPDGVTPVYRISGTYVYGHQNPNLLINRNVYYPRPPWMQNRFARTVPDAAYETFVIDANG